MEKRNKKRNLTEAEVNALLSEVQTQSGVSFGKLSSGITTKTEHMAWVQSAVYAHRMTQICWLMHPQKVGLLCDKDLTWKIKKLLTFQMWNCTYLCIDEEPIRRKVTARQISQTDGGAGEAIRIQEGSSSVTPIPISPGSQGYSHGQGDVLS